MSQLSAERGNSLNILVVRPDRIGDVVLSTPVLEVIKRHYPKSELTLMVRESVAPIVRGLAPVSHVMIYDPERRHAGVKGFFRLLRELRAGQFRIAVILQTHWKIALAVFLADVRYRVGPLSKLHSFLFFNRGVRQHRSQVEMHETDYNLQLLRRLGIRVGTRNIATSVHVSDEARVNARKWLESRGWKEGDCLIAVHPGMGGSALNWPEENYIGFIRALLKEGRTVLVTGGPGEGALLARMQAALGESKNLLFYGGPGTGAVDALGALLAWTQLVVAPSTGPLHIAVALGKPVVTFYPPVRVQSAIRWGPYVKTENQASVLVPEVYCGQDFECRGNVCHYFPCMKSLTVPQALEEARRQLERVKGG